MDKQNIRIYCYTASQVYVEAPHRSFMMTGGSATEPSEEIVTFEELEYINLHSDLIKNGRLEFEEDQREEIYMALRLDNWKTTCLFERDIDSMLEQPNLATLQRIISITDMAMLDRIRGHVIMHSNINDMDISIRVKNVVNARYQELNSGILRSRIEIIPKKAEPGSGVLAADFEALVAQKVAEALKAANAEKAPDVAAEMPASPLKAETKTKTPVVQKQTAEAKPLDTATPVRRGRPPKAKTNSAE